MHSTFPNSTSAAIAEHADRMHRSALAYLRLGPWSVFPVCHPLSADRCAEHAPGEHDAKGTGKTPLVRWKAYQDRLPTPAEIDYWFGTRWPGANLALATGHLSDVSILDLDGAAALAEAEARGYLPGPTVATGRVGGRHAYFQWRSDAPTVFASVRGVDFRGEGGFALLPPSVHRSSVAYRWLERPFSGEPLPPLPTWLNSLARERRGTAIGRLEVPEVIEEHMRNDTLARLAGAMRRVGFSQSAIAAALQVTNLERCHPPLAESEVVRIAGSVARYEPAPVRLHLVDSA